MRFFYKEKKPIGSTRIRHKFLFFPICIRGEMRWLEKAYIEEELIVEDKGDMMSAHYVTRWKKMRFVERLEVLEKTIEEYQQILK